MPAPPEHLAIGYLLYSAYARLRHGRAPRTEAIAVLAVATQLPDLIDKPLAWGLGALPAGHTLGHSLLFATPLVLVVAVDGRLFGADWAGPAFGLGYLSHLGADAALYVAIGDASDGLFLLWPLVPAPLTVRGDPLGVMVHVSEWYLSLFSGPAGDVLLAVNATLFAATLLVWHLDGRPGVGRGSAPPSPRRP